MPPIAPAASAPAEIAVDSRSGQADGSDHPGNLNFSCGLARGPNAHGWREDQRWAPARVATVIARRFHVRFGMSQPWRILRQMGWTVQVPPGAPGRRTGR